MWLSQASHLHAGRGVALGGKVLIVTRSPLPHGGIRSSPRTSSRLHFESLLGPATPASENRPCWLPPSAQVSQQSSSQKSCTPPDPCLYHLYTPLSARAATSAQTTHLNCDSFTAGYSKSQASKFQIASLEVKKASQNTGIGLIPSATVSSFLYGNLVPCRDPATAPGPVMPPTCG